VRVYLAVKRWWMRHRRPHVAVPRLDGVIAQPGAPHVNVLCVMKIAKSFSLSDQLSSHSSPPARPRAQTPDDVPVRRHYVARR
jgi:hypothetical protein